MSVDEVTAAGLDPWLFAESLVKFSLNGQLPDDPELVASNLTNSALRRAREEVARARSELEGEVRILSRKNAPDVDQWIQHANTLRAEINSSHATAKSIKHSAQKGDSFQQTIKDHEAQIAFLEKEQIYNHQLGAALKGIQKVHQLLNEVEEAGGNNRILDALHKLGVAASEKSLIPALASGRPLIMLEDRYVRLLDDLHEQFIMQWKHFVNVDKEAHSVTIISENPGVGMDLDSVFTAMESFKETEKLMKELSKDLNDAIFEPRFKLTKGELPLFEFDENSVRLSGQHNNCDVRHIISDLEKLITFLSSKLPAPILTQLSITCSTCVSDHMRRTWLDVAVPVRLGEEMIEFRRTMGLILQLADTMDSHNWFGSREFTEWVEGCAKIWLVKRKEYCLDWVRNRLAFGIGATKKVERVEKELVKHDESNDAEDWDANWDEEEKKTDENGDEWDGDAWGFGDDVVPDADTDLTGQSPSSPKKGNSTRNQTDKVDKIVTLSESYTVSSMPGPVFDTVLAIIEDALELSDPANETNPITPAAAGLFGVPTLVLAMYRAVAPYHYRAHPTGGGMMFQYNDSMWLASQLESVLEDWKSRSNVSPRAHGKIKFDAEIDTLQRWGKRAYTEELAEQKTIVKDLMGGTNSFLDAGSSESVSVSGGWGYDDVEEEKKGEGELEKMTDIVVAKIRTVTTAWKKILSKSAWAQASAALLGVVARKIVTDIQDRDSLGSEECERIAGLIDRVLRLDDLFVPMNIDGDDTELFTQEPATSEQAPPKSTISNKHLERTRKSNRSPSLTSLSADTSEFVSDDSFPVPDTPEQIPRSSDLIHEKIKQGEIIPLTIAYVGNEWLRLQYAKEILESNLGDIEWLWWESELGEAFGAEEVVGWVERCFASGKRRRDLVEGIRRGRRGGG